MRLTRAQHSIHTMSSTLVVKTTVCGYHVYRTLWEPHVGEEFIVIQESGNSHDRYAMAVHRCYEDPGVIMEHLSQEIYKTSHYFTRHSTHLALTRHFGSLDGVLVK